MVQEPQLGEASTGARSDDVAVHLGRYCPLKDLHAHHDAPTVLEAQQNAFHALQRPPLYAHALALAQNRPGFDGHTRADHDLQGLDFLVPHGRQAMIEG
jgi:hypothetical protein